MKIACWPPWSQASHASSWWHNVSQRSSYCSQHSEPHKVLTLSPAIWHCLTKDTNISNWIQPLCERFWPILGKDNMMFSESRAPASQSWIGAHSYSTGWNRFATAFITLSLLRKTTSIFYKGVKMSCLSVALQKNVQLCGMGSDLF